MTQREKTLSVAVAAAGVLWGGTQGLKHYQTAADRSATVQADAEQALDDANFAVKRGERARRRLQGWRARSLPTDHDVAKSLYQDWLRTQLSEAGLKTTKLVDNAPRTRSGQYDELSIQIDAEGALPQLADFLYRFYTAPHLHRISSATLVPDKDGGKLTASLTVDALILPAGMRRDALAEGPPQSLVQSLDDLRKSLMSRNMFAAYQPKPDAAGGPGGDAEASDAILSGLTTDGEGLRLDVRLQKSGEVRHFHEGDSISFGRFQGKLVELDGRRAVIETAAGHVELKLGQNFGEAQAVAGPAT